MGKGTLVAISCALVLGAVYVGAWLYDEVVPGYVAVLCGIVGAHMGLGHGEDGG